MKVRERYKINFSESVCRKPLSIRHEALHEVHWAFIAAVTRATIDRACVRDHVVIIVGQLYIHAMRQIHSYYSGPVREEKEFYFYIEKIRQRCDGKKKNFPSLRRKRATKKSAIAVGKNIWLCMAVLVSEFQH